MTVNLAVYLRPLALAEALELRQEPGAVVLCGGTDFHPERVHEARSEYVVDVAGVEEIRGVRLEGSTWRIGAATPWCDVRDASLPHAFDGLRHAARQVGGAQIQNAGTVGGNLCTASPAGDGIPPLLTLEASVEVQSSTHTRILSLEEFITDYRTTALRHDELLTAILVPDPDPDAQSSFAKLGLRSHLVISIAMVATVIVAKGGSLTSARVAVGACSPVARRLYALEEALVGCELTSAAFESVVATSELTGLSPISDVRASADYRERVVRQLVLDALVAAAGTT